jgi:anaerobic magnesium-protoporphyrin IX monomethyl ester cyclase
LYFTNPSYLGMIEKRFGTVARQNIESQTQIRLKRKLLEN